MYSLNFEMMVRVLQQFAPTGEFRASIPPQSALREGGQAVLIVYNGTIISCFILNRNEQKIYHDVEASRLLARLGILEWQLVSSPVTGPGKDIRAAPAGRSASATAYYPRHRPVTQVQLRSWPVLQRSVYFLANGTRGTEQIATILSRPSHTIEQALRELQAINAIE